MDHRIYNAVYCQCWNIMPGTWESIHAALQARHETPVKANLAKLFGQRRKFQIDQNGIAHVDVMGITGNLSPMEKECGMTDYGDLIDEFEKARDSSGLMLTINSPGGQTAGNIEAAEAFANFNGPKAVHIRELGASAGYKIAAGADYIVADKSAIVGSVGTILAYVDRSANWEAKGFKADYITSGPLKAAGAPPSLDSEERTHLQQTVDDYASQFHNHVRRFRSVNEEEVFKAGAYVAPRAKSLNLVDAVGSYESAYNWLLARTG